MRTGGILLGVALLLALVAGPAEAQGIDVLVQRCVDSGSSPSGCAEAAATSRALLGQIGLLASLGAPVPGATSALGRRLERTPRVALSTRLGGVQLRLPDLTDRGNASARVLKIFVPTWHGSITVGVFDGFRVMPTVGGFLSLDIIGQTSATFLPTAEGFDGKLGSLSLGARVGILRESFTLPGVTLSVQKHLMGGVRLADATLGDRAQVEIEPATTSYRLTVGKDLLSVGLLVGIGWDAYSASTTLITHAAAGLLASTSELEASRKLMFGGASLSFLVLQLSLEAGWAEGFSSVPGYTGAPFDVSKGSIFGSLSARLTI